MSNVRIVTKTSKGLVTTSYSNDQWNRPGWHSALIVQDKFLPIEEIVDLLVADNWQDAGQNHLKLCQKIVESK